MENDTFTICLRMRRTGDMAPRQRGFTLIELLVVIAIVALLMAITGGPAMFRVRVIYRCSWIAIGLEAGRKRPATNLQSMTATGMGRV